MFERTSSAVDDSRSENMKYSENMQLMDQSLLQGPQCTSRKRATAFELSVCIASRISLLDLKFLPYE